MSKNRDLIYDMAEAPETEDFEQLDSEPLQLGGVGEDASAANDRQVTTPGDVHVAPQMPTPIDGTLRQFALRVPDVIDACSGIMVFGKRIKSLVFSTDLSIIRNVNADAVFAVYPFTPQPIITQALLMASDLPVFVGVGGGLTTGKRVVNLAMYAEMQGATGVVVNAPTPGRILNRIRSSVDVPVVVTVANSDTNYRHRIEDGAAILNVAAGAQTPEIVAEIRERFPDYPIIATGGADEQSIRATIRAGANAIVWTPPSSAELFRDVMKNYREGTFRLLSLSVLRAREAQSHIRPDVRLRLFCGFLSWFYSAESTTHACSRVMCSRGRKLPSGMPLITPARCSACTAGRA